MTASTPKMEESSEGTQEKAAESQDTTKGYKESLLEWKWEMLACVLAFVCLSVIRAVFGIFDGHPEPSFPLDMTLNSLVAPLATICRTACGYVVVEGVSQMKWNHFAHGRPRPLSHLLAFDKASRGIWGSTTLLFKGSGRSTPLVLLVFLITATGLLTSTMTQSAITTTWQPVNKTSWVATSPNPIYLGDEVMSSNAFHKIQVGILSQPEEKIETLNAVCETGHCDYPIFSILGICAETRNVTSHLSFADSTIDSYEGLKDFVRMKPEVFNAMGPGVFNQPIRNASLPTGPYLVGAKHLFSLNMSGPSQLSPKLRWNPTWLPQNATLSFNKPDLLGSAISNFFLIWMNQGYFYPNGTNNFATPAVHPPSREVVDQAFRATEVLLHYCVQTFNVSVKGGQTTSARVDAETYVEYIDTKTRPGGDVDGSVTLRTSAANNTKSFRAMADSFRMFDNLFVPLFEGTYCFDYYRGSGNRARGLSPGSEAIGHAFWTRTLEQDPISSVGLTISEIDDMVEKTINNLTQNVAETLTNSLRNGLDTTKPRDKDSNSVSGIAYDNGYVAIRWWYCTALVVQVFATILFLAILIAETMSLKVDVVKGQLLPVLLAIDPEEKLKLLQDIKKNGKEVEDEVILAARSMAPRVIGGLKGDGSGGWKLE